MQQEILADFNSLPEEAQRQVVDFIAFLRQRYQPAPGRKRPTLPLADEPFIGMWRDREDLQDSSAWVRRVRRH